MKVFKDGNRWNVVSEYLNIKTFGVTKLRAMEKFAKQMKQAIATRTAPNMLKRLIKSIKK